MGQAGKYLRRYTGGYSHWCPACEEIHVIGDSWGFNGDLDCPTFTPSVKVTGIETIKENGRWNGEWVVCHYFLTGGKIHFQGDCTHAMRGQTVPLPELPSFLTDDDFLP